MSATATAGSEVNLVNPGLCRCCRTMKKCRILSHEYKWMGHSETYSDMFVDCFGLLLSHLDGDLSDCGVCATCVVRLRDACAFRNQVLRCEEIFLREKINCNEFSVDVKLEPVAVDSDCMSNGDADNTDDYKTEQDSVRAVAVTCSTDLAVDVKGEAIDNNESDSNSSNICLAKVSASASSKTKLKSAVKRKAIGKGKVVNIALRKRNLKKNVTLKSKKITRNPNTKGKILSSLKERVVRSGSLKPLKRTVLSIKRKPIEDDREHMMETNLINLVEYSYVCPFSNRFSSYYCYYCYQPFTDTVQLRTHTQSHNPKDYKAVFKKRNYPKLDITRIDCRLCSVQIEDLDTFRVHITGVHNKRYYVVSDSFLKFRLTDSNLACTVCDSTFPFFYKLYKHMVEHYSNFTCDICGEAFLDKSKLTTHLSSHDKHSCLLCGKSFNTEQAKEVHSNTIHNKAPTISCLKCDALLFTYYDRHNHMVQVHNESEKFPCAQCDKVYHRKRSLNEHCRRVHLKVKRHQCEFCSERFFTPTLLKDHLTTHTGEKNFRCEYCDKSYPRSKTLKEHIRIHTNDRRYKCSVCSSAFVQNVSLKCHMKSHHPDFLLDK